MTLDPARGARLLVAAMRALAFDPAQPRDEVGRWTDGGVAAQNSVDHAVGYSTSEIRAVKEYAGSEDPPDGMYVPDGLNGLLRGVNRYSLQSKSYSQVQEAYYRQQTNQLQGIIEKTPTTQDSVFYRGVDSRLSERLADGTEFTDRGFTAVTSDRRIAEERFTGFSLEAKGRVFEVRVPKGTPLLDVDSVLNPSKSKEYTTEREHLLGHGTRFKVRGDVLEVLR